MTRAEPAFDLGEPYVSTDPGDRDEHLVRRLRWRWLGRIETPRQAAHLYAALGLHPIAVHGVRPDGACTCDRPDCSQVGKHPVGRGWQKGPLDVAALERQLASDPDLNVGLRTGWQPCGRFLVVVDVDGPRALLEPLEREHGAFPPTLTARTGRGGLHLFYWLADGREMGNRAGVVPNVDVRGTGGQVVAAPSRHRSGGTYLWTDTRAPGVLP
jgi:putative DNA primase/helicase